MSANVGLVLPVYLLVLAGFLFFLNVKSGGRVGKRLSYLGMWAALIGSAVVAVSVYR